MSLKKRLIRIYTFILLLLALVITASYQGVQSLVEIKDWVTHTYKVIAHTNQIHKLVLDMETGERGFLITGRENFLEPYYTSINQYKAEVEELKKHISDNPSQMRLLQEVDDLVAEWQINAAAREIEARRQVNAGKISFEEVSALIDKETGKNLVDAFRNKVDRFITVENNLLVKRQVLSRKHTAIAAFIVIIGSISVMAVSVVTLSFVIRDLAVKIGMDHAGLEELTKSIEEHKFNEVLELLPEKPAVLMTNIKMMAEQILSEKQESKALRSRLKVAEDSIEELKAEIIKLRGIKPQDTQDVS